jgi:hypothetical protein
MNQKIDRSLVAVAAIALGAGSYLIDSSTSTPAEMARQYIARANIHMEAATANYGIANDIPLHQEAARLDRFKYSREKALRAIQVIADGLKEVRGEKPHGCSVKEKSTPTGQERMNLYESLARAWATRAYVTDDPETKRVSWEQERDALDYAIKCASSRGDADRLKRQRDRAQLSIEGVLG